MWATRTCMDLVGPFAQSRTARWRSGSATRRSTSSSRARPRSSAWSSPGCRWPSIASDQAGPRGCGPGDRVRRQRWQRLARVRRRPGRHGRVEQRRQPVGHRADHQRGRPAGSSNRPNSAIRCGTFRADPDPVGERGGLSWGCRLLFGRKPTSERPEDDGPHTQYLFGGGAALALIAGALAAFLLITAVVSEGTLQDGTPELSLPGRRTLSTSEGRAADRVASAAPVNRPRPAWGLERCAQRPDAPSPARRATATCAPARTLEVARGCL